MRKNLIIAISLLLIMQTAYSDAPDYMNSVTVNIEIDNLSSLRNKFTFFLYYDRDSNWYEDKYVELNYSSISLGTDFNSNKLFILAIPNDLYQDYPNPEQLLENGEIIATEIPNHYDLASFDPEYLLEEELFIFTITGYSHNQIFIDLKEKIQFFTNGNSIRKQYIFSSEKREYTARADVRSFFATSTLSDAFFESRYHPYHAFDGLYETGWSEGVSGSGIGESFGFELNNNILVDKVVITPGWFQEQFFYRNNRLKKLDINLGNNYFNVNFDGSMNEHEILLDQPISFNRARFTIRDVYISNDWNDTPISEIRFYYLDEEIKLERPVKDIYMSDILENYGIYER